MKKLCLFLVVIIFALSACSSSQVETNSSNSHASEPILDSGLKETSDIVKTEVENVAVPVKDELEFIEVGDFFDIGAHLYLDGSNIGIQAQFVDNAIHIWGNNFFRYDYIHGEIIENYDIALFLLG